MKYFKKIMRYALPYKRYGVINIICNIFYALFSALSFVALIPVIQVLFDKNKRVTSPPEWDGLGNAKDYGMEYLNYYFTVEADNDAQGALIITIALVLVLFLLKNLFSYLGMYYIVYLRNGVLRDIRDDIYQKVLHLPIAFFSEKRKGDTIARATADVQQLQSSFLSILELIFKEPLNIIFTLIAMLLISAKLTIFVLVFIPISGLVISAIGKRLKKKSERVQREQGYFLSLLEETLGGLKVIKGFNAEKRLTETFKASTQRYFNYNVSLLHRRNLAGPMSEFLGIIVIGVLLWFGGRMVLVENSLGGADFIAFMGLAYNILTPAKAIAKASYSIKQGDAAAHRVLELLQQENHIRDKDDAVGLSAFAKAITIDNITFAYDEEPVLNDFSLDIKKGQSVALVGQSGSGKSTIANLLTRFYDIDRGSIKIDGHDIRDLSLTSLRDQMAIVTQDSILFNDTVATNVALSRKEATEDEIIKALKVANAWDFVSQLPNGIHTNIGDAGNKLSGGQKQRLSIARAVLKNAPILILDEATSALDTESERLVQDALEKIMQNRTSIVIAHRLSTIQNADKIIVMKDGRILESGQHNELLKKDGTYKKLVDMQML